MSQNTGVICCHCKACAVATNANAGTPPKSASSSRDDFSADAVSVVRSATMSRRRFHDEQRVRPGLATMEVRVSRLPPGSPLDRREAGLPQAERQLFHVVEVAV